MSAYDYPGEGIVEKPYRFTFGSDDPHDPLQWSCQFRWMLCCISGVMTFSVAFISSSYAIGIPQIVQELGESEDIATLELSLFLVGFTLGPYGRRPIFILSTTGYVVFNIAICFAPSVTWILLLRLCSGTFGAAPLTNSGAVIADIFPAKQRGLAITVYALVPLFALAMGPLIGGFVAEATGWRGIMELNAIISGFACVVLLIALLETYSPVLLRLRAQRLTELTDKIYVSGIANVNISTTRFCSLSAFQPFQLACNELIILLLALYQALVFGTLYLTFAAFLILYEPARG
ncbi:MFS general substrate transporter [Penicillium nucicola]|uniref:MFS general substrate transporter n=1 Tax=Penicillium nucicola TaxID=1850975 RepID=UPI002544E794|nr:MFS general substrate transporter [Penicillium nucicola]KAJ5770671.1 MFS general substrate transporter [Penicillium nucicola]